MRASMAYFAGAGTVLVAIAAGLGGGLLISDILGPQGTKAPSKLEQHAATQAPQPSQSPANAPQAAVPYLAATQAAATTPVTVSPSPTGSPQAKTEQTKTEQAKTEQANTPPGTVTPAPARADTTASSNTAAPASNAQASAQQPPPADQASTPDNAYAKAREADLKQIEAKKKAERHQRWAARRAQQREAQQRADDDWRPGEYIARRSDRDESDRSDFGRPMSIDFPRSLFGPD